MCHALPVSTAKTCRFSQRTLNPNMIKHLRSKIKLLK